MNAALRLALLAAIAAFVLLPFAQTVMLSFVSTLPREGLAEGSFSLINYRNIVQSPELMASLVNSAVYVVLNVALCLVAGVPAAYALSRHRFVGDRHFLFLLLAFRVTPPVVLSLPTSSWSNSAITR